GAGETAWLRGARAAGDRFLGLSSRQPPCFLPARGPGLAPATLASADRGSLACSLEPGSIVMSVAAARPSAANPDVSDLLTRARAIGVLARERAQQTEADRRVGDDMIERMRQADLLRVMQPRSYGGLEHGFDVFAQIVAAIASGCGSTGWVYALLASHQWLIASFSKAAQDEVWRERTALAAGTYAPVGQAVAVDGGYRLSGVGSFCSGC